MQVSTVKKMSLAALFLLAIPAAQAADWQGNVSGYLGQKTMDDNDWPQHKEQASIGMLLDINRSNWPVSIAFDVFGTGEEGSSGAGKHDVHTAESHLGIRKIFTLQGFPVEPYVGGGVAFIYLEEEESRGAVSRTADDTGTGAWVGGGFYARLTDSFQLGVDVRYSQAELTVFDEDREAGGVHAGVTAGYHW